MIYDQVKCPVFKGVLFLGVCNEGNTFHSPLNRESDKVFKNINNEIIKKPSAFISILKKYKIGIFLVLA